MSAAAVQQLSQESMTQLAAQLGPKIARDIYEQAKSGTGEMAAFLTGKTAQRGVGTDKGEDFGHYMAGWVRLLHFAGPKPGPERLAEEYRKLNAAFQARGYGRGFGGRDMEKAIKESTYDSAGVLVPIQSAGEIIEFLRPASVLLDKVRTVPFKGELHYGKQTGGVTFKWVGEGETATKSDVKYGKIVLKAHKAMVLADLSNDLLSSEAGDAGLVDDVRRCFAYNYDKAAIDGDGTANAPRGVESRMDAGNSFANTGTTAAAYTADVDGAVEKVITGLEASGSGLQGLSDGMFLLHPTRATALLGLNTSGQWTFRNEMLERGTIRGFPFRMTTAIPATKILFGAWQQFLYGIDRDVNVSMHPDTRAEYDETVMRATGRVDFQVRHAKAFSRITGY